VIPGVSEVGDSAKPKLKDKEVDYFNAELRTKSKFPITYRKRSSDPFACSRKPISTSPWLD